MRRRLAGPAGTAWGLILIGLLLAGPVSAHADLLDADPRPNSRVDQAPDELELRFSERLEDRYTRIEVVGPNGTDHARATQIQDDRVRVTVPLDEMPDGLYTVRWRTLSAADGHTRAGVYLLGVNTSLSAGDDETSGGPVVPGNASGGADQQGPPADDGGPTEMTTRGLGFAGASLAVGVPLFLLVANGVSVPTRVEARWSWLAIGGSVLAALAALGLLALLAGRIDSPLTAAAGTTPGQNLVLRATVFAAAGGLLLAGERGPWPHLRSTLTGSGTLAAAGGLLVTTLGSHAAAGGIGAGLALLVDWTHQLAVAFWVSGVAALTVAGASSISERASARLVRRFSPLAVASVLVIVATGILASVDRLTSLGDLAGGLYGVALSAKILLLVPLVALGAYHRYILLPQLETPGRAERDLSRLRVSAGVELAMMVVVLVAAGVLTTASPPLATDDGAPYGTFEDALAADTPGPYAPSLNESELETLDEAAASAIELKLLVPDRADPLPTGSQPVWVLVYDNATGEPITDADVEMRAWMPLHGHGTSPETDPAHARGGMYEGATTWSMPGEWELRFNVTLASGDVLRYTVPVGVGDPAVRPDPPPEPVHTVEEDGFRLQIFVTPEPVTIGSQNLTVEVTPPETGFPNRTAVIANLKPPSDPYGEGETVELTRWREDTFSTEGPLFVEEGTWRVLVALQGERTYVQADLELDVASR